MRVAVLSDIHGNLPALDAVLDALAPFDEVWVLGDIVGYGPEPNEVVARLRQLRTTAVRGNHDAAAIGSLSTEAFNDDARTAVEWTGGVLTSDAQRWLTDLPERTTAGDFTLVHGSPRDPIWEYLFTVALARANLPAFDTPHCLVGHTHVPLVFRDDAAGMQMLAPKPGVPLQTDERRLILNPGSVGQPRDGDPRACGMLLDTSKGIATWQRVPYPIAEVQARMRSVNLPPRLVDRLAHGL
ncbi:MAG: metallophosphatase family protein [Chloroflexota bacterium]|nr:metallophosphatase family protein [Chloroflexota bacterium]